MDKIYLKDNYIVTELSGVTAVFGKNYTVYSENTTTFFLNSSFPINNARSVTIDFSRSSTIFNEAGTVAYTTATLRAFFLANTGFKSPVGGSTGITVGTTPISSGTDGRVLFQSGGVVSQDSGFTWDNVNKRLGILNSSPIYKLDVNGNANFEGNTRLGVGFQLHFNNNNVGLYRDANTLRLGGFGGIQFLSSATNINSQTIRMQLTDAGQLVIGATTAGARLDVRAQGALSTDIILRTRNSADTRNFLVVNGAGDVFNNGAGGVASNTFYGENSGRSATGDLNTFFGASAGRDNTTGVTNSFFGNSSGRATTTGGSNSFFGRAAGLSNTAGAANSYFGASAGQNANGTGNVFIGNASALNITVGNSNISIGNNSAISILSGANLTQSNESIFIGQGTKANANNQTNQIVIGHNAIGAGSNTATLGNTSIVKTILRGTINAAGLPTSPAGLVTGDIWNNLGILTIV